MLMGEAALGRGCGQPTGRLAKPELFALSGAISESGLSDINLLRRHFRVTQLLGPEPEVGLVPEEEPRERMRRQRRSKRTGRKIFI